jgi:hypothetical protein
MPVRPRRFIRAGTWTSTIALRAPFTGASRAKFLKGQCAVRGTGTIRNSRGTAGAMESGGRRLRQYLGPLHEGRVREAPACVPGWVYADKTKRGRRNRRGALFVCRVAGAKTVPEAPQVGDTYQLTLVKDSAQQGSYGSTGSSHDQDTSSKR